jgi:hypothetical protein
MVKKEVHKATTVIYKIKKAMPKHRWTFIFYFSLSHSAARKNINIATFTYINKNCYGDQDNGCNAC